MAPENGWTVYQTSFLLGGPIFRGYVSFKENIIYLVEVAKTFYSE